MLGVPRPAITRMGARVLVRVIKAMVVDVLALSSPPLRACTASLGSWCALQPRIQKIAIPIPRYIFQIIHIFPKT